MTLPALLAGHNHVSQREIAHTWPDGQKDDGRWEDCLWCAVVELLNLTVDVSLPDTLAYAELLRDASGEPPSGGSNAWDAQRGVKRVLGITLDLVTGWTALDLALKPGYAAAIAGSMGAFPKGHRLRRHDPDFAAGHSGLLAKLEGGALWWCDPLAKDDGYLGETITAAEAKRFVDGLPGGGHLVRQLLSAAKEDSMQIVRYLPGWTANIKPKSNIRTAPVIVPSTFVRASGEEKEPVTLIGTVKGAIDPGNKKDEWFAWADSKGRVVYTATDNVLDLKAPAAAGPAYPDVRPELAQVKAELAAAVKANNDTELDLLGARERIKELHPKAVIGDLVIRAVQAVPPKA